MKRAALLSIAIHFGVLGLLGALGYLFSSPTPPRKIKVEIQQVVRESPTSQAPTPEIQLSRKEPPPPAAKPVQKVFGLNKKTLQGGEEASVEIKAGNTVAKELDDEKITLEDAEALPIPAEEYLVTQMPRLKSEVRIPYPPQARRKNIEGTVVMDILIDAKGKVREAQLVTGPAYGLDEAALSAIYQFEFSPATIESQPVAVRIRYSYRFVLN